jgi:predicted DNA-binding protein (MmcQ/YjbR family)
MKKHTEGLVDRLRAHCRTKPGMTDGECFDDDEAAYSVLGGFGDDFAQFYLGESPPVLMVRCRNALRRRLSKTYAGVRVSDRMCWDTVGWDWTDVALDGAIPEATLLSLIDDSYQLVVDGLDEDRRHELSLIADGRPPREVLSELIARHKLERRRDEIEQLVRPALLLRTKRTSEAKLALGRSKIGGCPDLPEGVAWPTHRSGKPLAFLAQINLSEAQAAAELAELPPSGILSFFSVYGWQDPDDLDPQLPPGRPAADWTRVLYHADDAGPLRRHRTPPGVDAYKTARVDFIPILSLPSSAAEPDVARLRWSKSEREKYESLGMSFNTVRDYALGYPPRHLLLGFANYEQDFIEEVAEKDLRLLFQLASDDGPAMCWGDDGYLYFFVRPRDLRRRNFKSVYTDYQCG